MRKLVLLVTVLFLTIGCSKDEEGVSDLEVTKSNLKGKWYYSEIIVEDGSKITYSEACSSNRDYIEIGESGTIDSSVYYANCSIYAQQACSAFLLNESQISNCDTKYNGIVTELTNKKMRIDYDAVQSVWFSPNNYGNFKGVILTRN
jgi:hypothetical protein